MLRRAFAVAFAAATLALVPATASATPAQAPVESYSGSAYYASTRAVLSDGRTVQISLGESRSAGRAPSAHLYVTTSRQSTCPWGTCQTQFAAAFVALSPEQVDFSGSLGGASVIGVPVALVHSAYGPDGWERIEETVTISVVLTGTGPVSRDAYKGEMCGDGSRECQSVRVDASRAATAEITFGDETVNGDGTLFHGRFVDAAAPKVQDAGAN